MKVTNVDVSLASNRSKRTKGYATIMLDDSLKITNILVCERKNQDGGVTRFIEYPEKVISKERGKKEVAYPLVLPKNAELSKHIKEAIINEYMRKLETA